MSGETSLEQVEQQALASVAACTELKALDDLRVEYLGKKGSVTQLLKGLGKLPAEERSAAGAEINRVKQAVQLAIENQKTALETAALADRLASEKIDVGLPGRGEATGGLHPVTVTIERIQQYQGQY